MLGMSTPDHTIGPVSWSRIKWADGAWLLVFRFRRWRLALSNERPFVDLWKVSY